MRSLTSERVSGASCSAEPEGALLDRDHFAHLYEQTADIVFRYAWSIVRDAPLAEDICADVYLNAWRARATFRGSGSPVSWLLSIAHNRALSQIRASRREDQDLNPVAEAIDTTSNPEAIALAATDSHRLQQAIRRLTEEQQKVIFLRFFQGLRHDEIANVLGRNPNAIRALQFRALAQLRRHLEDPNARPSTGGWGSGSRRVRGTDAPRR